MSQELPENSESHAAGHDGLLSRTRLLLAEHRWDLVRQTGRLQVLPLGIEIHVVRRKRSSNSGKYTIASIPEIVSVVLSPCGRAPRTSKFTKARDTGRSVTPPMPIT